MLRKTGDFKGEKYLDFSLFIKKIKRWRHAGPAFCPPYPHSASQTPLNVEAESDQSGRSKDLTMFFKNIMIKPSARLETS